MSAYTPSMGGIGVKSETNTKEGIGFSQSACETELPAILRLSPAEKHGKNPGELKVKMQAASPNATPAESSLKIHMKPVKASAVPLKMQTGYIPNAAAVADPELLQQIPRLKETLRALDSEMHANASSDVEKRLQMHERILQLQGQKLEQTVKAVGQIFDTQVLHAKVQSATGHRLLAAEKNTSNLLQTSDMHTKLHQVSGEGLISLHGEVRDLGEHSALHANLHRACGNRVMELREQVESLGDKSVLHAEVHKSCGENVLDLKDNMSAIDAKMKELSTLSNELSRRTDLHTRLHKESNNFMKEKLIGVGNSEEAQVGGNISGSDQREIRQLRADIDALALENAELKRSVTMHGKLHAKTADIVANLGLQTTPATAAPMVCSCTDGKECTNCVARKAHTGNADKKHTDKKHKKEMGMHGAHGAHSMHAQLLTQLEADIASSNKPGKKHR